MDGSGRLLLDDPLLCRPGLRARDFIRPPHAESPRASCHCRSISQRLRSGLPCDTARWAWRRIVGKAEEGREEPQPAVPAYRREARLRLNGTVLPENNDEDI